MRYFNFLHYLRAIAAVLVIVRHVPNKALEGSFDWMFIEVMKAFGACAVPIFVMASGMLLLNPRKQITVADFYKRRLLRIGPAIIFWTLVYVCVPHFSSIGTRDLTEVLGYLKIGRPAAHLWFMYMIISLYLFTPFLRKLTASCTRPEFTMLTITISVFVLIKVAMGLQPGLFIYEFLIYIDYYLLGYTLFLYSESNLPRLRPLLVLLFLAAGITISYIEINRVDLFILGGYRVSLGAHVLAVCAFLFFMSFEHRFKPSPLINKIDGLGLGIYLSHIMFVKFFTNFGFVHIIPDSIAKYLLLIFVAWLLALLLSLAFRQVPVIRETV